MMEEKWSKKFNKCENCATVRFVHRARGLCARCYALQSRLEYIEKWNLSNASTLKGYPRDMIFHNEETFQKIKRGFIKQYENRLSYLKIKEQILNSPVDGSVIVRAFQRIAQLAGSRKDDFLWHEENLFDHNFTPKQKKILYQILNDIHESIRWKGIDWHEVFKN